MSLSLCTTQHWDTARVTLHETRLDKQFSTEKNIKSLGFVDIQPKTQSPRLGTQWFETTSLHLDDDVH